MHRAFYNRPLLIKIWYKNLVEVSLLLHLRTVMETDQLKLYSLSQAAKAMAIGRDSLRSLIADGKIGYILIGDSKKIPYQELIRFQNENTIHKVEPANNKTLTEQDINQLFKKTSKNKNNSLNGADILETIMRKDKNGTN